MVYPGKKELSEPQMNGHSKKKHEVYYVSHFATPIKDVRLKPKAIHKVSSVTNLTQVSTRVPAPLTYLKCKSLSLQDLSPGFQKQLSQRRVRLCGDKERRAVAMADNVEPLNDRKKMLAYKSYSGFLRNALRKNREASEVQDVYLKSAYGQIANFKIQLTSLKTILKSDEETIATSFKEIRTLKGLLSKLQDKYSTLKKEKEENNVVICKLKEELSEVRSESLNEKNSLILARSEATALEYQLQKEREKINKLKTENRILLEKVDKLNVNLKCKTDRLNDLNDTVEQMERQIDSNANLLRNAQLKIEEDERALEEASVSVKTLKKELGDTQSREGKLRTQLEEARVKTSELTKRFDIFVKEQTLKMIRLETELAMSAPAPLKSRVLSLATNALNVPLVILEAITNG